MEDLPFFFNLLFTDPGYFLSWVLVIAFSICVHEYAHAATALWRGDDTAARQGHLTLNPLVQMGTMSLVLLALIGIAWGAVPVDVRRLRTRQDAALVAFAGPAANLLLAILFSGGVLVAALVTDGLGGEAARFLIIGVQANAILFVFNLLPIPMLDGWRIYEQWIPPMRSLPEAWVSQLSLMLIMILWVTPAADLVWRASDGVAGMLIGGWLTLGGLG